MPVNCKIKPLRLLVSIGFFACLTAFAGGDEGLYQWPQNYLTPKLNGDTGPVKVKKVEIQVTEDGFFRFKRTFQSGKQEYFSFNLKRLKDMNYLGTTTSGVLLLRTANPDIIVQTYNDRNGNIDSMAAELPLQLKGVEPEGLDSLSVILNKIRDSRI